MGSSYRHIASQFIVALPHSVPLLFSLFSRLHFAHSVPAVPSAVQADRRRSPLATKPDQGMTGDCAGCRALSYASTDTQYLVGHREEKTLKSWEEQDCMSPNSSCCNRMHRLLRPLLALCKNLALFYLIGASRFSWRCFTSPW
jgi:hypothetical protein